METGDPAEQGQLEGHFEDLDAVLGASDTAVPDKTLNDGLFERYCILLKDAQKRLHWHHVPLSPRVSSFFPSLTFR